MHQEQRGFVLVLTLLIISLLVSLTTYIMYRTTVFVPYAKIAMHQQKAQLLAMSGIQLAISQLSSFKKPEKPAEGQKEEKIDDVYIARQLLTSILPSLNEWQIVPLTQELDGIKGIIQFSLMSEHGKIDLNAIYDFEKHMFVDEKKDGLEEDKKTGWRQLCKELFGVIQKNMGGANLFEAFEKFLKQRQYKLDDVTELLRAPGFDIFKNYIFYIPPRGNSENKNEWRPFFLADLFTVNSGQASIEPWLISDSIRGALGLKRLVALSTDKKESMQKVMQEMLNKFSLSTDWKKSWDQLFSSSYGKEYAALSPSFSSHLSTKFESTLFSVVSYGTFSRVTQRVYAILERVVQKEKDDVMIHVHIKKIYWL